MASIAKAMHAGTSRESRRVNIAYVVAYPFEEAGPESGRERLEGRFSYDGDVLVKTKCEYFGAAGSEPMTLKRTRSHSTVLSGSCRTTQAATRAASGPSIQAVCWH